MTTEKTAWERLREQVMSAQQVRLIDRIAMEIYHMHSLVLMENAALGCARWLIENLEGRRRAVILCGRGNNGGDGLAIARHLRVAGWDCQVVVQGELDSLRPDALANARVLLADAGSNVRFEAMASDETQRTLSSAEVIIDAMLGTGATGNPKPPFDHWIQWANASNATRVAIDLPTGVDADTGQRYQPAFQADVTLTFVAKKPAMAQTDASNLFGTLEVMPIGLPQRLIEQLLESQPEQILADAASND